MMTTDVRSDYRRMNRHNVDQIVIQLTNIFVTCDWSSVLCDWVCERVGVWVHLSEDLCVRMNRSGLLSSVFVHQFLISSLILLGSLWTGWWTCLTWLDCRVLILVPVLHRIVGTPSSRMVVLFRLVLCVQVEKQSKASTSSLELTWSFRGTHRPPLTTIPGSSPSEGQLSRWMWRAS